MVLGGKKREGTPMRGSSGAALPWRGQVWDWAQSGWAELSSRHWRPVGSHWRYLVERNKIRFTLKPPTPPASGLFYSSSQTVQEPACPELYGDNELLFHLLGAAFLSLVFLPQSHPPPSCQILEVCHLVTCSVTTCETLQRSLCPLFCVL